VGLGVGMEFAEDRGQVWLHADVELPARADEGDTMDRSGWWSSETLFGMAVPEDIDQESGVMVCDETDQPAPGEGLFSTKAVAAIAAPLTESMTHAELMEQILARNSTAQVAFLGRFSTQKLRDYLDHLIVANTPREQRAAWLRRGDTPAIVACDSLL